jgi:hypothetical protein
VLNRAAAIALACALAACAHRDDGGTRSATAQAAYASGLRATQARLVEQDRANRERRRAEIARVVTGSARDVTPAGSTVERFVVSLQNHGTRALRRVDGGVVVYGGPGWHRLGLASFSVPVDVAPGRAAAIPLGIPLGTFAAEGAGALALASGRPKRVELELTGYRLGNGGGTAEND